MFNLYNSISLGFINVFLIISASMVVLSNHAVFSLLFLVLCFIFSSFLLIFLECEFLALIFVVIYVGAIAVLFLFVVMMLNSKKINLARNVIKYLPVGFLIGFMCLFLLNQFFFDFGKNQKLEIINSFFLNINWYNFLDAISDVEIYGQIFYTYFVLELLIAGLILLAVIVGIVYLTNNYNNKHTIDQSTLKQLSVNSKFFN